MIKEIKDLAEKSAVPKLSGKLNDQSNPGVLWTGGGHLSRGQRSLARGLSPFANPSLLFTVNPGLRT